MNISSSLRAAAEQYSAKPALIAGDRVVTYADLDSAAMGLARRFLADGLVPGDRLAVHSANTIELVVAILAGFHAGLVVVPVNVRFKPSEIQYVLGHAAPRLCYCDPQLAPGLQAGASQIPGLTVTTKLPAGLPGSNPSIPPLDSPALILYTSGTTARPKGVTHTQRTLMGSAQTMFGCGFDAPNMTLVAMSLMHTSGLCASLLPTLLKGDTAVLLPRFDPAELLDLVERWQCTWTLLLPALMQMVAAEQERCPRDVKSLRTCLCGGDSVPVALQQRWVELGGEPIVEGYAMSESLIITYNPRGANRPGSIGVPPPQVELRLVDPEGVPVGPGEVGEITVRSAANFIGYWNDPEATARTLVDGWMFTGDLARLDPQAYLWFQGRRKEIIIRCGSNISPQEVEEALYNHPAVMEVGVVGVPDAAYGERVAGFVALAPGTSATESELREFARQRLADYKVPDRIIFLPSLPKGLTGKVQRRALKVLALESCGSVIGK